MIRFGKAMLGMLLAAAAGGAPAADLPPPPPLPDPQPRSRSKRRQSPAKPPNRADVEAMNAAERKRARRRARNQNLRTTPEG